MLFKMTKLIIYYPIKVILFTLFVILIIIIGIKDINLKTGNDTLIQTDTKVYQDQQSYEQTFGSEPIIVMLSDNKLSSLLSINNIQLLNQLENSLHNYDSIHTINSPVSLINEISNQHYIQLKNGLSQIATNLEALSIQMNQTSSLTTEEMSIYRNQIQEQENELTTLLQSPNDLNNPIHSELHLLSSNINQTINLSQLQVSQQLLQLSQQLKMIILHLDSVQPTIPTAQNTLNKMVYDETGKLRPPFKELILQDQHMIMMITLNGEVSDETKQEILTHIHSFLNENQGKSNTLISGKPVLDLSIKTSMRDSMQTMMLLSMLIMVIVLLITFRVRWSLIPLLIILIAVITTIGLMGWLNIPITMVSMAVFPILIGLGIDYAIQFQSRYTEELEEVQHETESLQ